MRLVMDKTDIQNINDAYVEIGYRENKIYFRTDLFKKATEEDVDYINNTILKYLDYASFENNMLIIKFDDEFYRSRDAYYEGLYLTGYIDCYLKGTHIKER